MRLFQRQLFVVVIPMTDGIYGSQVIPSIVMVFMVLMVTMEKISVITEIDTTFLTNIPDCRFTKSERQPDTSRAVYG